MSYDIYSLRVDPGGASATALETVMRRDGLAEGQARDPARDARKRSVAGALTTAGLGYRIIEHDYEAAAAADGVGEDEARRQLRHVCVDNGAVRVEIDEEHATVRVPYAPSLLERDIAGDVFATLALLRREADLVPYDPQLGRELDIDAERDRDAFLESFRRGVEDACSRGAEEHAEERPRAPWWKRLLGR